MRISSRIFGIFVRIDEVGNIVRKYLPDQVLINIVRLQVRLANLA
jgi:hypothetical protein